MRATVLLSCLLLSPWLLGCDGRALPRSLDEIKAGSEPESVQLVIDGKPITMDMESLASDEHVAAGQLINQRAFLLTATDRKRDFLLNITVALPAGEIKPGVYEATSCTTAATCKGSTIMPFLGSQPPAEPIVKASYKAPALGLEAVKVRIDSARDSYAVGIGGSKRITGSFQGKMANVTTDADGADVIAGKPTLVEGKFALNVFPRSDPAFQP